MSTTGVTILIIAVVVIAALIVGGWAIARRQMLRKRFGPEYDRAVAHGPSRTQAERELRERERQHAALELRTLDEPTRARYATEWAELQARFVDSPREAVRDSDALLTRLISDIGYPAGDEDKRLALLSVEHASLVAHYRDAHEITERSARGEGSTEQLRQAIVHYRELFADLLGRQPVEPAPSDHPHRRTS
jgi:hypothetical protein